MVKFNLTSLLRKHKVTIRELSKRTGVTLKRIREVRAAGELPYNAWCDWYQAITGVNIFDPRESFRRDLAPLVGLLQEVTGYR